MIKRSEPIFAVRNVRDTVAFYRDVLGGRGEWYWGEPVTFGGIRLDGESIMFNQQPELAAHSEGRQHFFFTDAVEELHAAHAAAGAEIVSPIENKPWGVREYAVRDPDGYHLRFSGPILYERPAAALDRLPEYVRIEPRLPTPAEYVELARSVGWAPAPDPAAHVARSRFGFVAVDARSSRAIGMLRVMEDAHAWFSVWDVVVRPEHQAQRIGTALIEAVLNHLRTHTPGAIVNLFTYRPKFYEALGFKEEPSMFLRL